MNNEFKDSEGRNDELIEIRSRDLSWRDREKRKTSVRVEGVTAKIRTEYILSTSQ
jgi:hypothetical protein